MRLRSIALLFVHLSVVSIDAEPVQVVVRPASAALQVEAVEIETTSGAASRRFRARLNETVTIDADAGTTLQVVAPEAYWAAATVRTGVMNELTLWPRALVVSRVETPKGEPLPRELTVSFDTASGGREARPMNTRCPVAKDGAMRCRLPALSLDLRFETSGFAPHYAWDVALSAEKAVTLPVIRLRRGGSVVGWVSSEVDGTALDALSVRVAPVEYGAPPEDVRLLSHTVRPNRRGFFQLTGLPPGMWRVTAEGKGVSPSRAATVEIDETSEAALRDVLSVRALASLDVTVAPPLDPSGKPWQVRLQRRPEGARYLEPVAASAAAPDGQWSYAPIEAGEHVLRIEGNDRTTYHRREIAIDAGTPPLHITVDAFALAGRVRIGDGGVGAKITLRTRNGEKVTATSDDSGAFETVLPFGGVWNVDVRLTSNDQEVSARPLTIERRNDDGTARADIVLPAGRIRGRVVDEAGRPVRAGVIVTRNQSPIADVMAGDGTFELVGLHPGPLFVTAESREGTSGTVAATASETASPLTLVLRKRWKLNGRLLAPSGRPIAGAAIHYSTPRSHLSASDTSTPTGRFELNIEADARSITLAITAPGFAAKLMLLRNPRNGELVEIVLAPTGARMIVNTHGTPPWPLIGRDGAFMSMHWLRRPWRGGGRPPDLLDAGWALDVEPGDYLICAAPDEPSNCIQQRLAPGTTTVVDAPRRRALQETQR